MRNWRLREVKWQDHTVSRAQAVPWSFSIPPPPPHPPPAITLPRWTLGGVRNRWQVSRLATPSLWKPGDTLVYFSYLLPLWFISFLYVVIIRQPEPFLRVRLMLWSGVADCLHLLPGGPPHGPASTKIGLHLSLRSAPRSALLAQSPCVWGQTLTCCKTCPWAIWQTWGSQDAGPSLPGHAHPQSVYWVLTSIILTLSPSWGDGLGASHVCQQQSLCLAEPTKEEKR